jgi:DNA-binding response OmpR family regulator
MTRRILVVDDEPDIAGLISFCLTRNDYRVRVATDAHQGLDELHRDPPDLLLLDLMLPGMTGWELLREIRRRPRFASLPVVMLSARQEGEDRLNADRLGAADYITKPFSPSDLVRRIHIVLGPVSEPDRQLRTHNGEPPTSRIPAQRLHPTR